MKSADDLHDVSSNEEVFSSSDDEEVYLPVRKKIKSNNCTESSTSDSSQESTHSTLSTIITESSRQDTAEALENVAENGVQQKHSINENINNNLTNDSANRHTHFHVDTSLQSTVEPDTRYIIHRPYTSEIKHYSMSDSVEESKNKHQMLDKPDFILKVREKFKRAAWQALDADDLTPEDEISTLDSITPTTSDIGYSIYEFAETCKVCNEISHIRQTNASHNEHEMAQPKPEPVPNNDCTADPLTLTDVDYSHQIENSFIIPEHLPDFNNQLSMDNDYLLTQTVEEEPVEVNVSESLKVTVVPHELSNTYENFVEGALVIPNSDEPMFGMNIAIPAELDDPNLVNITLPFDQNDITYRNIETPNEDIITASPEDGSLALQNHSADTERVHNPSELETNSAELDTNPDELDPSTDDGSAQFVVDPRINCEQVEVLIVTSTPSEEITSDDSDTVYIYICDLH